MSISALCPVVIDGETELLYFADSETGEVYALDFHQENAVLIDGAYTQRFIAPDPQVTKRGIRFFCEGSGTECTATLTVTMDNGRTFVQGLRGPYSVLEGILFYTEFDPTLVTGKVFLCELGSIRGVGVEVTDMSLQSTVIDGGGK